MFLVFGVEEGEDGKLWVSIINMFQVIIIIIVTIVTPSVISEITIDIQLSGILYVITGKTKKNSSL